MPISHDEVVHGKYSLINKMPGAYELKFAGVRAFMGYMMTHPGKKLMFMGGEIGQFREWDYEGAIEWFLLDYESHARLQYYFSKINHFYLENPELWQNDGWWDGFQWIDADNADESVLTYRRIAKGKDGDKLHPREERRLQTPRSRGRRVPRDIQQRQGGVRRIRRLQPVDALHLRHPRRKIAARGKRNLTAHVGSLLQKNEMINW